MSIHLKVTLLILIEPDGGYNPPSIGESLFTFSASYTYGHHYLLRLEKNKTPEY